MPVSQSLTLTQTGQSVANNTSQVRILWKSTQSGASYNANTRTAEYYVSINGGSETKYTKTYTLPKGTTKTILDTTITVPHRDDGTAEVTVRTWMDTKISAGVIKKTATLVLDDIPRSSSLNVSNGTLGSMTDLTINSAVSTFKHRLTYKCGDVSGYILGPEPETVLTDLPLFWMAPIGLAAENTTGTSVLITFTLYTYTANGTYIGQTQKTATFAIPTSVKPTCVISIEDTVGLIAKYSAAVQGLSKLKITVNAETSQSAPISTYSITANGATYNTNPATTGALKTAGTNKISATVKDTRGRTGSSSKNLDVLAYTNPTISKLTVHRCDEDGTENDQGEYVKAVFSAAVSPLNDKNKATYKLRYKKTTATSFTDVAMTALENEYTVTDWFHVFPAGGNDSYDVEVVVADNHKTYTRATSVSTAFTLLNWHKNGTGMGVGKVSEKSNAVEFGVDVYFDRAVFGSVYGLETLPEIPENADLNDYLTPGVYAVKEIAVASTLKNCPTALAGRLVVATSRGLRSTNKNLYLEQKFIPYNYARPSKDAPTFLRYLYRTEDTALTAEPWFNEALKAYPVGSIHMRYDTQNPADLFGGTWTQITARVLRAGSAGSIGAEGGLADGSGRTYIDIAVWRRTA